MKMKMNRSFGCKNEDLPIVSGFGAMSLARDLGDFTAYSPHFDSTYLDTFKTKIDVVSELVQPLSETVELKVITERMYQTLDNLIPPINYLSGYLKLAGKEVPISSVDFGLVQLRKSVRSRNVENVLMLINSVEGNISKYKDVLMAKGLTEEIIGKFTDGGKLLAADKNRKYALVSNRNAIVLNNLELLGDLYDQLTEVCRIGKIIYKQTNSAKLKDYTYTQIKKQVGRSAKTKEEKSAVAVNP